jgi:hypothetical protein
MGRVRKILTDTIIAYCLRENIGDPIIVCNDIDQLSASPTYLSDVVNSFKHKINPVFMAAPIGYGYIAGRAIGLPENIHIPELYLFNKVQDAINYCTRAGLIGSASATWPEGANLAFSGMAYCCAGGFDPRQPNGEDDVMGMSLYALLEKGNPGEEMPVKWGKPIYADKAWVATDPRRILSAIYAGRTGIEAWAWQDFTENPGSALNTAALAHKCENASWLLKKKHLESLSLTTKDDVWELVTSRIGWLFFRSVIFDSRARDFDQLKKVAEVFGIKITGGVLDRANTQFDAIVDWDQSPILNELIKIFG